MKGYTGTERPGVRLPFDKGYTGETRSEAPAADNGEPAAEGKSSGGGSKQPWIVPDSVNTGVFKVRGDIKQTAITGLQLERVGGTPGSPTGVNESANKLYEAMNKVMKTPKAMETWSLERIKEVLYEQIYWERVNAKRDAENDQRRAMRTYGSENAR